MSPLNYFQPQAVLSPCSPQSTQLLTSSPGKPLERRKQLRLSTSIWWEFYDYFSLLPIKLENNGSTAQCLTLCLKVEGTVYSLALIGHTYDTLSGATINTEAIENQETYIVKEGDHTANILVSFNLTLIQYSYLLSRWYLAGAEPARHQRRHPRHRQTPLNLGTPEMNQQDHISQTS